MQQCWKAAGRRRRLIAWAGLLALALQLAAPLVHGLMASALADSEFSGYPGAVICSAAAQASGHETNPAVPQAPSDKPLSCTLCLVCQAGAPGAKLIPSFLAILLPENGKIGQPAALAVTLRPRSITEMPPPSRAPPFLA